MKKSLYLLLLFGLSLMACSQNGPNAKDMPKPKEYMDRVSYMIGYDLGKNFARDSLKINFDYYLLGIKNAMAGDSNFITKADMDSLRSKFQEEMMKKADARMKREEGDWLKQGEKNKIESEKLLASNKTQPGVITTASGLQYKVIKQGDGPVPESNDKIKIHLKGYYIDGREFDNTYKRQPVDIDINGGIPPGWKEAFTTMKVGSIWRIWLPANLGWGEPGMRPTIPPNSALIFEIEILSIVGKSQAQPQQQPQN